MPNTLTAGSAARRLFFARLGAMLALLACSPPSLAGAANFAPTTVTGLIADITTANSNLESDIINLLGLTFALTAVNNGSNGLPVILSDGGNELTILNGTIERDSLAPAFRLLQVADQASLALISVTLRNGFADGSQHGGAILVDSGGRVEVSLSRFLNNSAAGNGGAIAAIGSLIGFVTNSVFASNSAFNGGAIVVQGSGGSSATLNEIRNSTFNANFAIASGGAVAMIGSLAPFVSTIGGVSNTTIAGNSSGVTGGGVYLNAESTITNLLSTIVASNTTPGTGPDINNLGAIPSASFNLIGDGTSSGITGGVNNNLVGTNFSPLDPGLNALADNGGPTSTMALRNDSVAFNNGANPLGMPFDQRRNGYEREIAGQADIGAYELQLCSLDSDADGSCDENDNCETTFNPDQADADLNGVGDACQRCAAAPLGSCQAAASALLLLKNKSEDATDSMKLSFNGEVTQDQSVFGNPTQTTETAVCLYYQGVLQASYEVPASATLWTDSPAGKGWKYADKDGTADGITSFKEQAGDVTTPKVSKIKVKGKGLNLPDPAVPVGGAISVVTVQIVNSTTATCFSVEFGSPFLSNKANTAATSAVFKAKL